MNMSIKVSLLSILLIGGTIYAGWAAHGRKSNEQFAGRDNIKLVWMPTRDIGEYHYQDINTPETLSLSSIEFADYRSDQKTIGINKEKPNRPMYVKSDDNLGDWCRKNMEKVLPELNITIVPDKKKPALVCQINEFKVIERSVYEGAAEIKFLLVSPSAGVIYERLISAKDCSWGQSYKLDNYLERLSDTFVSIIHKLTSDGNFLNALKKHQ